MHAVWNTFDDLVEIGRGILRVNLHEAPHTQKGQIPDRDFPADDVIDTYKRAMHDITIQFLKREPIIDAMQSEEWNALYFDVKMKMR